MKAESNSDSTTAMGSVSPPQKRVKKIEFWNVVPNCVDITDSIQSDHIAELHKEFQKPPTKQDQDKGTNEFDIRAPKKGYINHRHTR